MTLAPYGVLKLDQRDPTKNIFTPMPNWPTGADYRGLLEGWLGDISNFVWPNWSNGTWNGAAAVTMEASTKFELELAVQEYQGGGDQVGILSELPDIPPAQDGQDRDQRWHYNVEDSLMIHPVFTEENLKEDAKSSFEFEVSRGFNANFTLYDPTFDNEKFTGLFLGQLSNLVPSIFDIKAHFQRPRPWTASVGLNVIGFRWVTAYWQTHTGLHPSLLSGHCIQGILGGCSVLDALYSEGATISDDRKRAIQKYMVDWGDRRVFAGVHYMSDNIGSWTLARRLIPHLFQHSDEIDALLIEALTQHSRVFKDIVRHFPAENTAKMLLLQDFPEAVAGL